MRMTLPLGIDQLPFFPASSSLREISSNNLTETRAMLLQGLVR